MQWLIDLIIEAIGIPPVWIDRGDAIALDFDATDFITDEAMHTLDLSGIVPDGAKAVALAVTVRNPAAAKWVGFAVDGYTSFANGSWVLTQIADMPISNDFVLGCSADRKVSYMISNAVGWVIEVTVKGWWL